MEKKLILKRRDFHTLIGSSLMGVVGSLISNANAQNKEVVMATFGGTIEQFVRTDIVPAFEKLTGLKVKLVVGTALSNYSKVLATKNKPEIDVYWSNELTHEAGKQQVLYEKLDSKLVPNMLDAIPVSRDPDGIGTGVYIMATGLQYNSKAFKEAGIPAPTSWYDLWDPRLKGKVALFSFDVAYSQDLIVIMTKLAGGNEKNIRLGIEKIKTLKTSGNLVSFANSPAELDNMLIQGQAWITVNGSPRAFLLKEKGAPIDFAYPKEGAGYFTNYFELVKNSPNPLGAQLLINFMSSPEIQLIIAKNTVTAPVNKKVIVPESLKSKIPFGDEQINKLIRIDRVEMNKKLDEWAEVWRREIEH